MRVTLIPTLLLSAVAALQLALPQEPPKPQDPPVVNKPQAPVDATPLPPVQEPRRVSIERDDLIQRFVPKTPITGFWKLRMLVDGGHQIVDEVRGYLAIGRSHLSLQISIVDMKQLMLQSGFRSYRIENDELVTTSLIGFDNHGDELRLERSGMVERRRFSVAGSILRVMQSEDQYMEFERIE